jgi:hypothetical protein
MPAETSIPCSRDTLELVKSSKEYDGQSYDELLRTTFGEDGDGERQSEGS